MEDKIIDSVSVGSYGDNETCVVCFGHTQNRTVCAHVVCRICIYELKECPICRFDLTLTDGQILDLIKEKDVYICPPIETTPLTTQNPTLKYSKKLKITMAVFLGLSIVIGGVIYAIFRN